MNIRCTNLDKNITFNYIDSSKFNCNYYTLSIILPLNIETVTLNALLPYILMRGSKLYPTYQKINIRMDELLGADFDFSIVKKGHMQILQFRIQVPGYTSKNSNIDLEIIEFFKEILFNPLQDTKGCFRDNYFHQEKRKLSDRIRSLSDNKSAYAVIRCIETMFDNKGFGINKYGYINNLDSISNISISHHYKEVMKDSYVYFSVCGNKPQENIIKDKVKEYYSKDTGINFNLNDSFKIIKDEIQEKMNISQDKISIGFMINDVLNQNSENIEVFNHIFGGGPSSKLFKKVREQEGMAYYIYSQVESIAGVIVATAGVDKRNRERTKNIIIEELENIKKANISHHELENAKKTLINNYISILDNPFEMSNYYLESLLKNNYCTIEEKIRQIDTIQVKDIVELSNSIEIGTTFSLVGEE